MAKLESHWLNLVDEENRKLMTLTKNDDKDEDDDDDDDDDDGSVTNIGRIEMNVIVKAKKNVWSKSLEYKKKEIK